MGLAYEGKESEFSSVVGEKKNPGPYYIILALKERLQITFLVKTHFSYLVF